MELTVNLNLPSDELWIKIDLNKLSQIITNLFSNATKFTPKEGTIDIRVTYERLFNTDQNVKINVSIKDTGIGMTSLELSRLFIPFNQANNHISSEYGGSGLGLIICKKLIEKMDGKNICG